MAALHYLELTLATPEENLACDEALLERCEAEPDLEILRFWEPTEYFVVVGYANKISQEVNVAACRKRNISIFRRNSGGGAVLQGPGCLNYSLVLGIQRRSELESITGTNCLIMKRHAEALSALSAAPISVQGYTDLAVNDLKFSGNAQRRQRNCLLFHGTFLLDFDIELIQHLLPPPSHQPPYRQNRSHAEFLRALPVQSGSVKEALRAAWDATCPLTKLPREQIQRLVREKYSRHEWNFKW